MLSPSAEKTINNYFNLPFPGVSGVRCPYYNNKRSSVRGQLRVLGGKGSPEEIIEESKIISIQYHLGLFENNGQCKIADKDIFRKFLIDHNLGIECSGFVTQVLRDHFKETQKIDITRKIFICSPKRLGRYLISKLRPIENIDVKVLADDKNSTPVKDQVDIKPGDIVTMLETGPQQKRNHVLLVKDNNSGVIKYVHARAWSSEGQYGHGVAEGTITIVDQNKGLLEQKWIESGKENDANETYLEAKNAKTLEVRRLRI
jgi:hypothetical protein